MTTPTKVAERRKAQRQARSLRISWRVLGNRHLRYGEAALKDIGTEGLALQVDQLCPKGAVVIVQFEGAAGQFAEPMLLQAEQSTEPRADEEPRHQASLLSCPAYSRLCGRMT